MFYIHADNSAGGAAGRWKRWNKNKKYGNNPSWVWKHLTRHLTKVNTPEMSWSQRSSLFIRPHRLILQHQTSPLHPSTSELTTSSSNIRPHHLILKHQTSSPHPPTSELITSSPNNRPHRLITQHLNYSPPPPTSELTKPESVLSTNHPPLTSFTFPNWWWKTRRRPVKPVQQSRFCS